MTSLHVGHAISSIGKSRNIASLMNRSIFIRGYVVIPNPSAIGAIPLVNFLRTDIRAPGVVDHAATISAISNNERVRHGLPTSVEIVMVLIGAVVIVVGGTGVTTQNVSSPCHAVHAVAISISTYRTNNVRAMVVVNIGNPISRHFELFALFIGLTRVSRGHGLRIAVARGAVLTFNMCSMEAVASKIWMILKQGTGVHNPNHYAAAVEAESICRRCIHSTQAPIFLVFSRFPGGNVADLALFNVGRLSNGADQSRCSHSENGQGFAGFSFGFLSFVCNDELAFFCVPNGLVGTIHRGEIL